MGQIGSVQCPRSLPPGSIEPVQYYQRSSHAVCTLIARTSVLSAVTHRRHRPLMIIPPVVRRSHSHRALPLCRTLCRTLVVILCCAQCAVHSSQALAHTAMGALSRRSCLRYVILFFVHGYSYDATLTSFSQARETEQAQQTLPKWDKNGK